MHFKIGIVVCGFTVKKDDQLLCFDEIAQLVAVYEVVGGVCACVFLCGGGDGGGG